MDKLRIGIYINREYFPSAGGATSYQLKLIELINQYEFNSLLEIVFVVDNVAPKINIDKEILILPLESIIRSWPIFLLRAIRKIVLLFRLFPKRHGPILQDRINNLINIKIKDLLILNRIELLYYISPVERIIDIPYIVTHWDLGHKSMFAFPEVAMHGNYEGRERYHRIVLGKAFAIFVESEHSKAELIKYERINPERIFVVPIFPGKIIDLNVSDELQDEILTNLQLINKTFFFYPAQFWSHKNHYCLIRGFELLLRKYPEAQLVLCGSDKGNLDYILNIINKLGLSENIHYLGFVTDEELYTFYKKSIAIVMPTFLGPTNMPLLEAYALGCPIICSSLTGHKELLGDYATYFDPKDYQELANKLIDHIVKFKEEKMNRRRKKDIGNPVNLINEHLLSLVPIRKAFDVCC